MRPCPHCLATSRHEICERCALRCVARRHALRTVIDHVADCAVQLGLNPAETFRQGDYTTGTNRNHHNVLDREHLYYLARSWVRPWGKPSYPQIAAACGLPNHSTVLTAIGRVQARVMRDDIGADGRLWAAINLVHEAGHPVKEPNSRKEVAA